MTNANANSGSMYLFTLLTGRELDRKRDDLNEELILERVPRHADVNHGHLLYSYIMSSLVYAELWL